jgi:hypothetical protein
MYDSKSRPLASPNRIDFSYVESECSPDEMIVLQDPNDEQMSRGFAEPSEGSSTAYSFTHYGNNVENEYAALDPTPTTCRFVTDKMIRKARKKNKQAKQSRRINRHK